MQLSILFSMLLLLFQSTACSALPQSTSITCYFIVRFHVMLLLWGEVEMKEKGGGVVVVRGHGVGDGNDGGGWWKW